MASTSQTQRSNGERPSFRENLKFWGSAFYLYVTLMSVIYSWSYYNEFGINIFNFSGLSDFLLIFFSDISTSLELFFYVLIFALAILLLTVIADKLFGKEEPKKPAAEEFQPPGKPQAEDSKGAWIKFAWNYILNLLKFRFYSIYNFVRFAALYLIFLFVRSLAFTILLSLIVLAPLVPFLVGKLKSQEMLEDKSQGVRVTFRQDVAYPIRHSQKPFLQIGTTNSFLFLYSPDELISDVPEAPATTVETSNKDAAPESVTTIAEKIKSLFPAWGVNRKGQTLIVPVANLASVVPMSNSISRDFKLSKSSPLLPEKGNGGTASGGQDLCTSRLEAVATIGSFPKGVHDRLEGIDEECRGQREEEVGAPGKKCQAPPVIPEHIVAEMKDHFKDRVPQHLMLTGRVDSQPLTPDALQFYGTQMELAKARAEWVRGELLKEFSTQIDPRQITLRTARPRCPDLNASNCTRALDRIVEVHACWASNE